MEELYLTFTSEEDGSTVGVEKAVSTIQYSTNGQDWNDLADGVTLNEGEKIYVKTDTASSEIVYNQFNMTGKIAASGNITSMGDMGDSCYYGMFRGCTSLTQAPELPATTLVTTCYYGMFQGCTSLTQAPELPATTLAATCYYDMFLGCTSLTQAPELPATTLATTCYYGMFHGCTSLTQAPDLPATTLALYCYRRMFQGCTSLTQAPELPATTLVTACYEGMFQGSGVTSIPYFAAPLSQSQNIPDFAAMGITEIYLSRQGKSITGDKKQNPHIIIKDAEGVRDCNVKEIRNSVGVERCKATTYTNSYFSNNVNNTYACADTLNGGWNK